MNAITGLLALAMITLISGYHVLSPLFLVATLGIVYYRWLRKDIRYGLRGFKIFDRLAWLLFREVIGRAFFDIGVIQSLIYKRKTVLGRE